MGIMKGVTSIAKTFTNAAFKTASYLGGIKISRDDLVEYSFADLIENDLAKPLGRYTLTDGKMSGFWAGNGIDINVNCKKDCILQIDVETNDKIFLAVFFDGVAINRPKMITEDEHTFTTLVPKDTKTVRVIRDIQVSTDTQKFFCFNTLKFNGKILPKPENKKLYIEVIGDSIACGDGANGVYVAGQSWTAPDDHSFIKGFAYKLADKLNADLSAVCRGGIGLYSNSEGSQEPTEKTRVTIDEIYDLVNGYYHLNDNPAKYDFERKPDLIIFEISGNDTIKTEDVWKELAVKFLKHVKKMNGENIPVIWSGRSEVHCGTVKSIIEDGTFGDTLLDCRYVYGGSGAAALKTQTAGHPSDAEQTEISDNLYNFIKEHNLLNVEKEEAEYSIEVTDAASKKSVLKKAGAIGGAAVGAAALGIAAAIILKKRKK